MMQQDELAVIRAYREAVSENRGTGWTTCRLFIERRVNELCHTQQSVEQDSWRTDCVTKTLGYDAF